MDNEIAYMREQIDRQIRPGQSAVATVEGGAAGPAATLGGSSGACVVQCEGGAVTRARYGRSRYGEARYG
ncbi:MAG: hypothetical protein GX100_12655 [candidate division WS1 bacterium]|jgi:hypothetical protein|nr:hypothetical protein [candidate division WS1 bacterium]